MSSFIEQITDIEFMDDDESMRDFAVFLSNSTKEFRCEIGWNFNAEFLWFAPRPERLSFSLPEVTFAKVAPPRPL